MRKLGQALGVEAMSLDNHVANKGEPVARDGRQRHRASSSCREDGNAGMPLSVAARLGAQPLLIKHRWACGLALIPSDSSKIEGPRVRYMEWLLRRLREGGFTADVTYSAYHTLDSHIFGFTLWQIGHADAAKSFTPPDGEDVEEWALGLLQQMRPTYPYLAEHGEQRMTRGHDGDAEYEFGLDLILDGLKKLRRKR